MGANSKKVYAYNLENQTFANVTNGFDFGVSSAKEAAEKSVAQITLLGVKSVSSDKYNIVYVGDKESSEAPAPSCIFFEIVDNDLYDAIGFLGQWLDEDELNVEQHYAILELYKKLLDFVETDEEELA